MTTLYRIHDSQRAGQPSKERCPNQSRLSYYWPRIWLAIPKHIDVCHSCEKRKSVLLSKAAILNYPAPSAAWDAIAINILQLTRNENGKEYMLVMMSHLSRFCILVPLPDKSGKTVACAIVYQLICEFASPKSLLCDNGGELDNAILEEICNSFYKKIQHNTLSSSLKWFSGETK